MTRSEAQQKVNELLFLDMREEPGEDGLGVALASYFESHSDRPEDDPDDPDHSWGEWTLAQCHALEKRMVEVLTTDISKEDNE